MYVATALLRSRASVDSIRTIEGRTGAHFDAAKRAHTLGRASGTRMHRRPNIWQVEKIAAGN